MLHVYRGHDVDSYRTEVIGVILAMGRYGGLHFKLDNYSAMFDTMSIISKPFAESVQENPGPLYEMGISLKSCTKLPSTGGGNPSMGAGLRDTVRRGTYWREK